MFSPSLFRSSVWENLRWEQSSLDGINCRKLQIRSCQFDTTFGQRYVGLIEQAAFSECQFIECRIDGVRFLKCTFRDCRFDRITATKTRWESCSLDKVQITGQLVSVNFTDGSFRSVDLGCAELGDCGMLGNAEDNLILPDKPTNFVVAPPTLTSAEAELRSKLDSRALEAYLHVAKVCGQLGPRILVDEGLFEQLAPNDRRVVMETLYKLRRTA